MITRDSLFWVKKIQYIATIVLVGFFCAVVFHYIKGFYFHAGYPKNTFIYYRISEQFKDFYDTLKIDSSFNPYFSPVYPGEYFPVAYLFFYPLTFLSLRAALFVYYLIFLISYVTFLRYYFSLPLPKNQVVHSNFLNVFIIGFLSYPFLFSFERGNLEEILFILLAAFLYFYEHKKIAWALPFLVLAISFKAYPMVFLVLLWSDKHYKAVFITIFSVVILSIFSLMLMPEGFIVSLHGLQNAMNGLSNSCALFEGSCIKYSEGLWGVIKIAHADFFPRLILTMRGLKIYMLGTIVIFAGISFYVVLVEKVTWKKIALLTFSMLLFPVVSYDYKLLEILLPLAFFLKAKPAQFDICYATFFALLLIPKNYYFLTTAQIGISSLINPIILVLMSALIIYQGVVSIIQVHKTRNKQNDVRPL